MSRAFPAKLAARLAVPTALLIASVLLLVGEPPNALFRTRFLLSRRAFASAAESCGRNPRCEPRWIGLFPVLRTHVAKDQVRFITSSCGVIDACGVVYAPAGAPRELFEDRFTPLGAGWYHVYEGF